MQRRKHYVTRRKNKIDQNKTSTFDRLFACWQESKYCDKTS